HGRIALKLGRRIGDYVEQRNLGATYAAETGFLLRKDPDTVRAPDVAFATHATLGELADEPGYLPFAPDLVAEVISPSDRSADVEEKVLDWLAAGVRAVIVVDPITKTVRHYRSSDTVQVVQSGSIDVSEAIPGFHLNVSELFASS
ncbi:MAG: Uma2 family endonuclease, partial [Planctomycetota bacterium]